MKPRFYGDPMSINAAKVLEQLQKAARDVSLVTTMSYKDAFNKLMWAVTTSTMTVEEAKVEVEKVSRAMAALGKSY
jgi:hypothetical protein